MFMSNPGRGGRGKAAPYSTIHYRIPEPIKPTVERLAAVYRIMVANAGMLATHDQLIKAVDNVISQSTSLETNSISEVEKLQQKVSELEAEIERLKLKEKDSREQLYECVQDGFKAADILRPLLKLKTRQGAVMKEEIEKALKLIDDV